MPTFSSLAYLLIGFLTITIMITMPILAYEVDEIVCATEHCGAASDLPKTVLISVNPNPLPTVDQGDAQSVVVLWSVRFGLRAKFELCTTASTGSGPNGDDQCTDLPGALTLKNTVGATIFEDSLKLHAGFYRSAAEFYIRTTSMFNLNQSAANTATSNRRAFNWPLTMPNLYSGNPDWTIINGHVHIEHRVSNRGQIAAGASTSELEVNNCDGLAALPLVDPNDPMSDQVCDASNSAFVTSVVEFAPVGYLAAGTYVDTETDINHHMPQAQDHSNGLWLSIRARVDIHNDVGESQENDNARFQTVYFAY